MFSENSRSGLLGLSILVLIALALSNCLGKMACLRYSDCGNQMACVDGTCVPDDGRDLTATTGDTTGDDGGAVTAADAASE